MNVLVSDYAREFSRGNWDRAVDDRKLAAMLNHYFTMGVYWNTTRPKILDEIDTVFRIYEQLDDMAKIDFYLCFPYIQFHTVPQHKETFEYISRMFFHNVDILVDAVIAQLPRMTIALKLSENELIIKAHHAEMICESLEFKRTMPENYMTAIGIISQRLSGFVNSLEEKRDERMRIAALEKAKKTQFVPTPEITEVQRNMLREKLERERRLGMKWPAPRETEEDWMKLYEIMDREARNHEMEKMALRRAAEKRKLEKESSTTRKVPVPTKDTYVSHQPNKLTIQTPQAPAQSVNSKYRAPRSMLLRPYVDENGHTVHRVISDSHRSTQPTTRNIQVVPKSFAVKTGMSLVQPVTLVAQAHVADNFEIYNSNPSLNHNKVVVSKDVIVVKNNNNKKNEYGPVYDEQQFKFIEKGEMLETLIRGIRRSINVRELAQLTHKYPKLFIPEHRNSDTQQIMAAFLLKRFGLNQSSNLLNLKIDETFEIINVGDSQVEQTIETFFEMNFSTMEWARWRRIFNCTGDHIEKSIEYLDLPERQISIVENADEIHSALDF